MSHPLRPGWKARAQRGLTLVEIMISLGILAVTSMSGVSAFILINRFASNERNLTAAKELCQERIEQAQTMTYVPTKNTPTVTCQTVNGTTPASFKLLGDTTDYDTTGQLLKSLTTSNEPVNIYLRQDNGVNVVQGTRTTSVALPTNLTDIGSPSTGQLKIVQFTVTVAYTYRSQNYAYTMYTLRSAD